MLDMPAMPRDEAARWIELGRCGSTARWFLLAAWLVIAATGMVLTWSDPVCSEARPCANNWGESLFFGQFLVLLWWLVRHPALAIVGAVGIGALLWIDPDRQAYPGWFLAVEALAVLASIWEPHRRLQARRQQAALAERWSTTVPGLDVEAPRLWRRSGSLIAPACILGAIGVCLYVAHGLQEYDAHAARAVTLQGEVVKHAEDETVLVVQLAGERRKVETWDALGYPVGTQVTVLVDGEWDNLASEPYAPSDGGILVVALLLAALTRARDVYLVGRDVAPLRHPHAALRIDVVWDDTEMLLGSPGQRRWLGAVWCDRPSSPTGRTDDDTDWAPISAASVHGPLAIGRTPVVVASSWAGPVTLVATGRLRLSDGPVDLDDGTETPDSVAPPSEPRTDAPIPDWLPRGAEPIIFTIGPEATALQVGIVLAASAFQAWLALDPEGGIFGLLWLLLVLAFLCWEVANAVAWRATVDATGIHLRTLLNARSVTWTDLQGITEVDDPVLWSGDEAIAAYPRESSLPGMRGELSRLGAALLALHAYPQLRPTRTAEPAPPADILAIALSAVALGAPLVAFTLR